MRRNHYASKLTHSERPGRHEKKAADEMGSANRLPFKQTELIMTGMLVHQRQRVGQTLRKKLQRSRNRERFRHVTAQWGDSATP